MSHGFDFQITINGAATDSDAPTKAKVDRYRVTRKNYYNPANLKKLGAHHCVRCNEILGARVTYLYVDRDGHFHASQGAANVDPRPVAMGVFCAVTALEDGETMFETETETETEEEEEV
jgi:hypothetical protein